MTSRDDIRDLLAAVALGAATDDEVQRVERAAAADPGIADELSGLRAAAGSLALDVPQVDPPESLRRGLMAEVRADAAASDAPITEPRPTRPRRGGLSWLRPWPVAAVAAAAALGLLVWNISLQAGGSDEVTTIAVRGTSEAPGVTAEARVLPDGAGALLTVTGLPTPPEGQQYELWVVRADRADSGGFLPEGEPDVAAVAVTDLDGATALAVTAEPPTNTAAPTTPPVIEIPLAGA